MRLHLNDEMRSRRHLLAWVGGSLAVLLLLLALLASCTPVGTTPPANENDNSMSTDEPVVDDPADDGMDAEPPPAMEPPDGEPENPPDDSDPEPPATSPEPEPEPDPGEDPSAEPEPEPTPPAPGPGPGPGTTPTTPTTSACCYASADGTDTLCADLVNDQACMASPYRGVAHAGILCSDPRLVCNVGACCSVVVGFKVCKVLSLRDCDRLDMAQLADATFFERQSCCDEAVLAECGPNPRSEE